MDKLYAEGIESKASEQDPSTPSALDQLSSRVETAERERDEALLKRDSVLNQLSRNDLLYVALRLTLTHQHTMEPGLDFSPVTQSDPVGRDTKVLLTTHSTTNSRPQSTRNMYRCTLLPTRNAWHSPASSPPGAIAPAKLRSYWTEVRQFLSDV